MQAVCVASFAQTVDGPVTDPTLLAQVEPYSGDVAVTTGDAPPAVLGGTEYIDETHDPHLHFGPQAFGSACCGDCPPGWRIRADGLLFSREDVEYSFSNAFDLGELGYEEGGRISLIRHIDCLDAWEISFISPIEWEESGQVAGVGLNSLLTSTTLNLSEFNNATLHEQLYQSQLGSLEFNRRWFGWDVISTFAGVRYLNLSEDFLFTSTGAAGTGALAVETNNHLLGGQVGLEMMFPIGRWMTMSTMKGGLYGNSVDGNMSLVNNGVGQFNNRAEDIEFAATFEFGYHVSFQITPSIKVRGGYEFLWLYGISLAPDQVLAPLTAFTGDVLDDDETYYHGATGGVEIIW